MTWYCANCGSAQVYAVQPTADASGRTALGMCGVASDEERHGCSFRGTEMKSVPLIDHQTSRVRRKRPPRPESIEAFPGADFAGSRSGWR